MSAVPLAASRAWVSPPRARLRASPRARLAAARAAVPLRRRAAAPLRVSLAHRRAGPAALRPPRLAAVVVRASAAAASEPDPALRAEDVLLHLLGLAPPRDANANANDDAEASPSPSPSSASASASAPSPDLSPTSPPPASSSPSSSSARERWLPAPLVAFSRMSLLFFLAALFFATAHLVGAGASLAASLTASITPVVFLANGAAVTNAAAAVSGGLNAWAANAASVAVTAVASGASGAVGYSVAAARARAEMAALRAELEELRRVVGETAGAIETRMNERRSEKTDAMTSEGQPAEETTIGVTIATGKIESGGESSSLEEVDWAALAKSRAVWSPPGRDEPEARASAHASPDDVPFSAAVAAPAGPAETPRARVPPSDPADVDAARRAALAAEIEELRARLARVRAVDAAAADADADDAAASLRFGDDERSASNALSKEEASSASSSASSRERADAAEALAALREELAELRRAKSSEASDDAAPTDGAAGAAADVVDWAALAKSRAVWSPPEAAADDADVVDWAALAKSRAVWSPPEGRGGGGAGARTAEESRDEDGSAEAASEASAEAAARAGADALDAEDAEWRRRLREGASKPKPRGGEEA